MDLEEWGGLTKRLARNTITILFNPGVLICMNVIFDMWFECESEVYWRHDSFPSVMCCIISHDCQHERAFTKLDFSNPTQSVWALGINASPYIVRQPATESCTWYRMTLLCSASLD